jgi:hypothetical protein
MADRAQLRDRLLFLSGRARSYVYLGTTDLILAEDYAFLQGFLRKLGCRTWCFDGEFVVECVVKLVS